MTGVAVTAADRGDVFQVIADSNRRKMLRILAEHEQPVSDLAGHFRMSQPSVSEHLRILRSAGLVEFRREGRQHIYSLKPMRLREVADWIATFDRFWEAKLDALGAYLAKPASPGDAEQPSGRVERPRAALSFEMEID